MMRYYVVSVKTPLGRDDVFDRIKDLDKAVKVITYGSGWQIVNIGVRYE